MSDAHGVARPAASSARAVRADHDHARTGFLSMHGGGLGFGRATLCASDAPSLASYQYVFYI